MTEVIKAEYQAEYAKSDRSKCKQCSEPIKKDTPRLGKLVIAEKYDGEYFAWFHPSCFYAKFASENVKSGDIKKFSELKFDDQEKIKTLAGEESAAETAASEVNDDEDDESYPRSFIVEYARSGKSTCRKCHKCIENKGLRIGETVENPEYHHSSTYWYHFDCYKVHHTLTSTKELGSYSSISANDKKLVKEKIDNAAAENEKTY